MKSVPAALVVFCLICPAFAGDCQDQIDTAVETFINEVFTASRMETDLSQQDRQKRYQAASLRLTAKARELHLEIVPLERMITEYLEHTEETRSPPPGWDPDDRKGNLSLFHEMATVSVRIDLALMSYGRRSCLQESR